MRYYLIKTNAKPIELMDCKHIIGGKHYQGTAFELSEEELRILFRSLTYLPYKDVKELDDKLWEVISSGKI